MVFLFWDEPKIGLEKNRIIFFILPKTTKIRIEELFLFLYF